MVRRFYCFLFSASVGGRVSGDNGRGKGTDPVDLIASGQTSRPHAVTMRRDVTRAVPRRNLFLSVSNARPGVVCHAKALPSECVRGITFLRKR